MRIFKIWFGKKVRELRKAEGLTQGDLAEKVGVETASVSRWETGDSFPEEDKFEKICAILKVDPSVFLQFSQAPTPSQAAMADVISKQQKQIDELAGATDLSADEFKLLGAYRRASILRQAQTIALATGDKKDLQAWKDLKNRLIEEHNAIVEAERVAAQKPQRSPKSARKGTR